MTFLRPACPPETSRAPCLTAPGIPAALPSRPGPLFQPAPAGETALPAARPPIGAVGFRVPARETGGRGKPFRRPFCPTARSACALRPARPPFQPPGPPSRRQRGCLYPLAAQRVAQRQRRGKQDSCASRLSCRLAAQTRNGEAAPALSEANVSAYQPCRTEGLSLRPDLSYALMAAAFPWAQASLAAPHRFPEAGPPPRSPASPPKRFHGIRSISCTTAARKEGSPRSANNFRKRCNATICPR